MEDNFEFTNFKEVPISEGKWGALSQLLFDASKKDDRGQELRELFALRGEEYKPRKLEELKGYEIYEEDLDEIHEYLESIFHDSPLRFWWW